MSNLWLPLNSSKLLIANTIFWLQISNSNLLPSEPPDVGNWFSSYKYESFILDTCDEFGGSIFKESDSGRVEDDAVVGEIDKEGNVYVSGRYGDSDCKRGNQLLTETPDTTDSPSLLYAAPHEGNWFPSYVSESPLDTFVDNEESVTEGGECQKDGFPIHVNGNINEKEEKFEESSNSGNNNKLGARDNAFSFSFAKSKSASRFVAENESLNKITDSQQLSSFTSEPSDIRSWFSSYAYESPVPSEIKGLLEETQCREGGEFEEDKRKGKAIDLQKFTPSRNINSDFIDGKVFSNQNLKFKSSPDGHRQNMHVKKGTKFVGKENSSLWINLCRDGEQKGQAFEKDVRNFPQAGDILDCGDHSIENLEVKIEAESTGNNTKFRLVNVASVRKCPQGNDKNQSKGNKMLGNGFVTRRTDRILEVSEENSTNWPQAALLACPRNKKITPSAGEDFAMKKKTLTERTNFEHSYVDEVTGKWRCPQKDKPNIRPLKQLRLEQWVLRP
ncbi:hypothetical protein K2173_002895 [Erythroxylum novogranatense]|uniref:Uncharacterized protein n=1 Tax=Erythroxylum novogranatense TaxID=1862640 RepID=A0AAV8SR18_9ROSI|nr:hypothetical protein K2173_002895 [Erythroxylum novogranatense]